MTRRVYVHVGPFKTGSTFIQGSLWERRRELRAAGVLDSSARRRERYGPKAPAPAHR